MAESKKKVVVELNAVDKASAKLKSIEKRLRIFGDTAKTVGGILTIGLGFAAIKATFQLAKLGTRVQEVEAGFKNLAVSAGVNSRKLLDELNKVSRGTISQLDLMTQSNQALLLMGARAAENLPEMLQIARDIAIATGKDVDFMFESFVVGAGRQSRQMLDNLGIIVSMDEANKAYAKTIGKTVEELTDQERKTAFLNAALESGRKKIKELGVDTDSVGDIYKNFGATLGDLKVLFARDFEPTMRTIITDLNKLLRSLIDNWREFAFVVGTVTKAIQAISLFLAAPTAGLEAMNELIQRLKTGMQEIVETPPLSKPILEGANEANVALNKLDNTTKAILGTAVQSFAILGEAVGNVMFGVEANFGDAIKRMVIAWLDMAEKMIQSSLLVKAATGEIVWNPTALPGILAATAGIEALKAGIGAMGTSPAGGGAAPKPTPSQARQTAPTTTVPAAVGGGGGRGVINIELVNPTFLSAEDFGRAIDDMFNIARERGWDVDLDSSVSLAEA